MIFSGETIDAQRAYQLNIATEIVHAGDKAFPHGLRQKIGRGCHLDEGIDEDRIKEVHLRLRRVLLWRAPQQTETAMVSSSPRRDLMGAHRAA